MVWALLFSRPGFLVPGEALAVLPSFRSLRMPRCAPVRGGIPTLGFPTAVQALAANMHGHAWRQRPSRLMCVTTAGDVPDDEMGSRVHRPIR